MADLLSRVRCKPFYLAIFMTLFISSCGDDDDKNIEQPEPVNTAPTISSPDTDTASVGVLFTYTLAATDADGDAVTFQASILPTWLTFNPVTGELSGTPDVTNSGDYQVTLGASDGVDSTPLFLTISIANSAPTITSTANNNGVVGSAFSYMLTANDVNTDTLVFSSVTLPSWATFDAASGTLSGTPDAVGDAEVELSVSDGELSANQKFTLVVTDVASVVLGFDEALVFSDFGGAVADVITNPDPSGINTSDKVGRMQKFAGEVFGGTTISLDDPISLAAKLLFGQEISLPLLNGKSIAANNVFTLKVWSQRQVELTFKLEGDVDANDVERVVTHDGTGWEVLNFDFTGVTGTGYTAITLIFDNGVVGDAADDAANWTFYFDDMVIPVVSVASSVNSGTAIDFEGAVDSYAFGDFGGGQVTILANPDPSGINTSAQVAEMKKNNQEVYGGTTYTLDSPIDIPDGSVFTLKVWSPRVVAVLFKLEGMNVERIINHGGNGWEELTFDFTGDVGTGVPAVTLIFDNGTMGDGGVDWTFYFDDMILPAVADGGNTGAAIDFEGAVDSYAFGDFGGGQVTILANPDPSGINTSAQVAEMKKNNQEVYGGTTYTLDSPIDIPDGSVFTLKVWSPRVVAVLFKLEGMNVERIINHGGNGWEELTFDFTGDVGTGVPAVTLIFDNGTMGDGGVDWTFYFDDMTLPAVAGGGNTGGGNTGGGNTGGGNTGGGNTGGGNTGAAIDFEGAVDSYAFGDFGGGQVTILANPDPSGINTSAQVAEMKKNNQEVYGGTTYTLDSPIDIPDGSVFTLKVWSPRVVAVLFKLEGMNVERIVNHGGNGWEELTFDFTGDVGTGVPAVTLIFDNGTMGDGGVDWTFYFDDMTLPAVAGGGNTGGGNTGAAIDFEGAVDSYAFGDFGGGQVTILANPDPSGINTSAQVAEMKKNNQEVYGGTTYTLDSPIDIPDGSVFTLKVWSPRVVAVLFKLEGMNVERIVNHGGNGWEELTFDFTGDVGTGVPAVTLIFDNGTMGDGGVDWTFYFDDMTLPAVAGGGNTGGGNTGGIDIGAATIGIATGELTSNGDVENSNLDGWTTVTNGGIITVDDTQSSGSAYVAKMVTGSGNPSLALVGLAAGTVVPGDVVNISFDMCGELVGVSGQFRPSLLSERGNDEGATLETLATFNPPDMPTVWTRYNYVANAGVNVTGGVTLQFDAVCGAVAGCGGDIYIDNVSVTIDGSVNTGSASGLSCVAGNGTGGGSTGGGNTGAAIDFEGAVDSYAFGDFGGGQVTILANPDPSGINTSAQVAEMKKNNQEVYGGTTYTLDSPIDIPDGSVFTLKVWSPRVVAVLFKLEGMNVERIINHGGNGWEELTFDFTGDVGTGVPAVTLIFDNGTMGDGGVDWTFYFDDMILPAVAGGGNTGGGSGSGLSAIDFEAGGVGAAYTWTVFENSDNPALDIVANPYMSGANTSATVAKFTARVDGQAYAGVESAHGDFGPLTLDATNSLVKIMVWKSVISDVGLKFAIANDGAKSEIKVPNTQVNQWEEITFDLSANIGAAESINIDQIIIFPDFNTRNAETISYFDNITFGN